MKQRKRRNIWGGCEGRKRNGQIDQTISEIAKKKKKKN